MTELRILFTGDRDWDDWAAVVKVLEPYPRDALIISGAARGLDTIAEKAAEALGFKARVVLEAQWSRHGRAAGPMRNREMLVTLMNGGEDTDRLVLAFHDDLSRSKGTKDMVNLARKAGVRVKLHRHGSQHAHDER